MAMTSKEKKEYIALGIIFGLMILILGYYFFGSSFGSKPAPIISATMPPGGVVAAPSGSGSTALPGGPTMPMPGGSAAPAGPLLPNGTGLDLNILQDPRFTSLVPPVYPKVTSGEVGSSNPFLGQ